MYSFTNSHNPYTRSESSMSSSSTSTITGSRGFVIRSPSPISSTTSSALDTSSDTYAILNLIDDNDIDFETSMVIAELFYEDLQSALNARKGKSRYGAPLSDSEYALEAQSEQLESMLNQMRDAKIAKRMQDAISMDRELIQQLVLSERVAQQDREAALALNQGQRLPPLTHEQRAMDRDAVVSRNDMFMSNDTLEMLSPKQPPPISIDKGKRKAVSFGPSSSTMINIPSFVPKPAERPKCVSCDDSISVGKAFLKAPCEHHYCAACITHLVRAAAIDESLFPVRCCRTTIPTALLTNVLSSALFATFQAKAKEFGTPANARVYCSVSTCSAFLGNADEAKRQQGNEYWYITSPAKLRCDKCRIETCVDCRRQAHPNDICKHNQAVQEVKDLARAQGWQTCPRCERIIELSIGCNHMTCYCGFEFCYECAAQWKTCPCEQWEERRLYATAEARMERDLGAEAQRVAPIQWRRDVEEFAENLRVNHDCYPGHRWKGHGPGMCEECGAYMPVFLKMCRECRLTVCRRCALNRL